MSVSQQQPSGIVIATTWIAGESIAAIAGSDRVNSTLLAPITNRISSGDVKYASLIFEPISVA